MVTQSILQPWLFFIPSAKDPGRRVIIFWWWCCGVHVYRNISTHLQKGRMRPLWGQKTRVPWRQIDDWPESMILGFGNFYELARPSIASAPDSFVMVVLSWKWENGAGMRRAETFWLRLRLETLQPVSAMRIRLWIRWCHLCHSVVVLLSFS